MIIKGKKIYLKKGLIAKNYPLLLTWFHNLETMKYVSWVRKGLALKNIEELKKFISKLEDGMVFGIYDHNNNFIGYTSLSSFNGKEECEFGIFILNRNYQGKGIGKEVTRLVLKYAFRELGMKKVILSTSEFNQRAIKLYKKVGFKRTKLISKDRTIYHNREWVLSGTVEMEISKEELK